MSQSTDEAKSIDEILIDLVLTFPVETEEEIDAAYDKAKSAIRSLIEKEVIGNFVPRTRGKAQNPDNPMYWDKHTRACMGLIEQQRAKLKEVMGGE